MSALLRDVRYGIRSLAKAPGLAFVATLALTLGIGLTTVMFSIIYGAMMKGLPFDEGDRIVQVERHNAANGNTGTSDGPTSSARLVAILCEKQPVQFEYQYRCAPTKPLSRSMAEVIKSSYQ